MYVPILSVLGQSFLRASSYFTFCTDSPIFDKAIYDIIKIIQLSSPKILLHVYNRQTLKKTHKI